MPVFDYSFTVDAPLEAVRDFHHDTSALKKLTPPPTIVQLHSIEPLGEGSVSRFTLWVGPLPLKWKAVHRNVSDRGFTDVQAEGPAAKWEHTHTFVPLSAGVGRPARQGWRAAPGRLEAGEARLSVEAAECGDNVVQLGEECDDGDLVGGDGCEADCTITPVCGDGSIQSGEECDDNNSNS
jgi:cysteine-rich repeat protein